MEIEENKGVEPKNEWKERKENPGQHPWLRKKKREREDGGDGGGEVGGL